MVDELKNFTTNNLLQVGGVSHVLGSVHHWLVKYWDLCINGEIAATIQVQLGIAVRVQL